jgi:pantetheine-phosphate adenylyltransferase
VSRKTLKALYAGSFDPWTFGHQFVLETVAQVFDEVHVLCAVNPNKLSTLSAPTRACLVAHTVNPFVDWWQESLEPSTNLKVGENLVVAWYDGLVADYATEHGISHLIRGLRSTTDFESEFNWYFSNHVLDKSLRTWAVFCPPELLYCSSTYVKTVVGKKGVPQAGTGFLAQAHLLGRETNLGWFFDVFAHQLKREHMFHALGALQKTYSEISNYAPIFENFTRQGLQKKVQNLKFSHEFWEFFEEKISHHPLEHWTPFKEIILRNNV